MRAPGRWRELDEEKFNQGSVGNHPRSSNNQQSKRGKNLRAAWRVRHGIAHVRMSLIGVWLTTSTANARTRVGRNHKTLKRNMPERIKMVT